MNRIIKKTKTNIANQKKKYLFLGTILCCGIISGILFLFFISSEDKFLIKTEMETFLQAIQAGNLNYFSSFWNSLSSNFLYFLGFWILGISIIGIPIILFLLFLKGFIFGFSFSILISQFQLKGIGMAFSYLVPHHILLLIALILMAFYAMNFSSKLFRILFFKENISLKYFFQRYNLIFGICCVVCVIAAVLETFAVPFFLHFFL